MTLGKKDRGLVLRFLQRVSGYSQAQIKRLVRQFVRNGTIKRSQRTVAKFKRLYTVADAVLLAQTDALLSCIKLTVDMRAFDAHAPLLSKSPQHFLSIRTVFYLRYVFR